LEAAPDGRRWGQALVEFALLGLLLVLMLAIGADFGRAFSAWIAMGNMARAGAQYGTIVPLVDPLSSGGISESQIRSRMVAAALAEQPTIFGSAPSVTAEWVTGSSCQSRVTVRYDFQPILQVPPIPSSITLTRSARMRIQYLPPGYSCSS
jgi:Flp pilus assembly protein TadG